MSTSSVSKGCFVFKPSARKRKTPAIEEHFARGCDEPDGAALRYKLCRTLWDRITADTGSLQDELNRHTLDKLLDFAGQCHRRGDGDDWAARMRASEIPAAALMLGVNVPDHDATLQSLSELLRRSVTPHVAALRAKECGALKHALKRVLERVTDGAVDDDDNEADDDEHAPHVVGGKGARCSVGALCDWYDARYESSDARPPVVVIFNDFEAFGPRVLQEFVQICSRYVARLPLVFVFGIATSPSAIRSALPHSVTCLLCVELFQSPSCTRHLAAVVDALVLTHAFPFKLGGRALQVLVGVFLYHDFSVRNFVKGLQVALLEHFRAQPLSVLCCAEGVALDVAAHLRPTDLQRMRQLPSFQSHVGRQREERAAELMTDDASLREEAKELIASLHEYHRNYFPVLKCLHALTSSLPRYPLGKQVREVYLICLERSVWENEDYLTAVKVLKMLSKDELAAGVQRCVDVLEREPSRAMRDARVRLQELLDKLKGLDLCAETAQDAEPVLTSPLKNLQKKTDLFQLQKTLLEMGKTRRAKKLSPFELLRIETVDFVDSLVRTHLAPPETQPLHEVLYYRSAASVRRHLNAAPRTSIQAALSDPFLYLRNDALRAEGGGVSSSAPDICVAYKLHLECGRLINLFDWLEAYCTVVSAAGGADPEADDDFGRVDQARHARFIQAVSELEFLGFIKSTKQKTDHVARLTWGGC
ncbi:origin recognition complex subunit 3 [Eucyclogobius newberryi]|uniref:origin recognition complex subunit 3 n=1 Tax=Eucyclogobius newberryi TaxID=166745 RepID=UPI003B5B0DE3